MAEHREMVRKIAEHTAKHFDEFILDDFFFTSCKSDIEIKAKGSNERCAEQDHDNGDAGDHQTRLGVVQPAGEALEDVVDQGKRARQERTVRHGNERPGRRSREPDYRCARPNQVIPRHASGIVRPTGGNRLCQSGDRHVGFDALSYSSAPSSGSTKPIFRFQPKPTRLNSPPGFRWHPPVFFLLFE